MNTKSETDIQAETASKKAEVATFDLTPEEFDASAQRMDAWNHGELVQGKLNS